MSDPTFGTKRDDQGNVVDIAQDMVADILMKAPKLSSIETTMLMREQYETAFGIYNHDSVEAADRLLSLVAMQPAEDTITGSELYYRLKKFADFGVPKHFNMSLKEFMENPRYINDMILTISEERQKVDAKVAEELNRQLSGNTK